MSTRRRQGRTLAHYVVAFTLLPVASDVRASFSTPELNIDGIGYSGVRPDPGVTWGSATTSR